MAHFNVNPSSSDYVNWEKRLELYYKKQIFEKECQLKKNLEMIKKEYQVKMEKAALELKVKTQKLLQRVNEDRGRGGAIPYPVVEQVGETAVCFSGGDTTTVLSHSFNSADTYPQPPITALSNTYSPHITHDDVVQVNADTLPLQSFSVTPTTDSSTTPQSHSFDSADPIILTKQHLFDSSETNPTNPAQVPSLDSTITVTISLAQPHAFDGPCVTSISCNVSLCGQSVGTNLPVVLAQSHTSSVPPDMSTTDNQSDSLVTPAQTRMTNTPLHTPTTTSSTGGSSSCPSSATSSVALDHVDNTLSDRPPTGIPFHSLNSDIQQPISVTTPTHSASPPGVHVSCTQPTSSTLLVQELCDPSDMNSYQSGLLGNAFPRGALVEGYSTFVYQAPVTSWATQGDENDWPPFKMFRTPRLSHSES